MSWAGALDKTGVRSRWLACWSANSQGNAADDGTEAVYVLMPSTPLAYPRVVSRAFALLRVPKVSVPAVQRDFCAEFDSGSSTVEAGQTEKFWPASLFHQHFTPWVAILARIWD